MNRLLRAPAANLPQKKTERTGRIGTTPLQTVLRPEDSNFILP